MYGGGSTEVGLTTERPVRLLVPRGTGEKLSGKIVYTGPLAAPVEKGAKVAELKILHDGSEILSLPLETAEAVPVGSLPRRALDAGWELGTALIRQQFHKP